MGARILGGMPPKNKLGTDRACVSTLIACKFQTGADRELLEAWEWACQRVGKDFESLGTQREKSLA